MPNFENNEYLQPTRREPKLVSGTPEFAAAVREYQELIIKQRELQEQLLRIQWRMEDLDSLLYGEPIRNSDTYFVDDIENKINR